VYSILMEFHFETVHPGIDRLVLAAKARYQFPPHMKITERVLLIRRGCLVCQSRDSPNLSQEKPIRMNPVIEGFWASVCLDFFPLPPVEWRGENFDCILLCVDRASNRV